MGLHRTSWDFMGFKGNINLVGGIPTPLKNDGVRQLRLLFPMYENFKNNSFMFKTTNQLFVKSKAKPTSTGLIPLAGQVHPLGFSISIPTNPPFSAYIFIIISVLDR